MEYILNEFCFGWFDKDPLKLQLCTKQSLSPFSVNVIFLSKFCFTLNVRSLNITRIALVIFFKICRNPDMTSHVKQNLVQYSLVYIRS